MIEERDDREVVDREAEGAPRWLGLAVIALAVVSLLALGVGWSASNHAKNAEQGLATDVQSLRHTQDVLTQRLAQSEEASAQVQGQLHVVTDRLKLTQGELTAARRQAKVIKEDYGKKLQTMESSLATKASSEDVNKLGTDVTGVKGDLESTKNNLQMARGELGTLIARNHEEIEQLRRLGERDYYEFTLGKKGSRQKVGNLMVELRGINPKRNQFSVALYVDDMRLEKKNRSINEPIYFYTRGSRAPLELVVNQLGKSKVSGYISAPKAVAASSTGS